MVILFFQVHWLKTDFNKWKDEDDSDFDEAEDMQFENVSSYSGILSYICVKDFAFKICLTNCNNLCLYAADKVKLGHSDGPVVLRCKFLGSGFKSGSSCFMWPRCD